MTQSNPFSSPAAPGAPDPAPRPRDLVGCLVAYSPREFTAAGAPGNEKGVGEGANASPPRDRVTADLIVLATPGDQPIAFGGSPEWERKPTPHYLSVAGPARFDGVWVNNQTIVKALAPGGQPLVGQLILGVIERSTFGNMPFNLVAVDGTPQMAKAIEIYTALSMGAMAYRQPQPIPGAPIPQKANAVPAGPMPPANSVNYGYAPSPVPSTPTAWTTPPPAAPAPVMPPMPGIPAPPASPPPAAPAFSPAFDFAAFQAQQAQAALAAAGLQPAPVSPWGAALPTQVPKLQAQGWTAETWSQLNPEQAAQVLATVPAF